MSKSLTKIKELSPKVKAELSKEGLDIAIGDVFLKENDARILRITDIRIDEYKNLRVSCDIATDWEATEWRKYDSITVADFKYYGYTKIIGTVAEWRQQSLDIIEGKITIDSLADKSNDKLNDETALMARSSKEGLIAIQKDLEQKQSRVEMIKSFVAYEMEKRKQALNKVKEELGLVLKDFEKKIKRIMRVITTIELYLGIEEEIFQIQEGEKAHVDTPISFRQQVLYMDEEVGITDHDGLDFQDVEKFDEWLITNDNYKKLLPELKGIVVFRPRREEKDYGHPFLNAQMNRFNLNTTYLLIRNGDCLYRIYTEKITILPRLFPRRKELMEMLDSHSKLTWDSDKKKAEENFEDSIYQYRKRAVLLQGLLDRTEIFHPLPRPLSIFKMEECADMINFIYDDEATLPSGRLSFWDWHTQLNSTIQHGSRVAVLSSYRLGKYDGDRIFYYCNEYSMPTLHSGVYEVEKYKDKKRTETIPHYYMDELKEKGMLVSVDSKMLDDRLGEGYETHATNYQPKDKNVKINLVGKKDSWGKRYIEAYKCTFLEECLTIMHNPKDTVYGSWGNYKNEERKKRIRFRIEREDRFLVNYDQITLEDIEFYLESRVDRPDYLHMLPKLKMMKQQRLKELENEKHFAKLVEGQLLKTNSHVSEKSIWDAMAWWKLKNMIKRPIDKDDAKALRMIVKHLTKK